MILDTQEYDFSYKVEQSINRQVGNDKITMEFGKMFIILGIIFLLLGVVALYTPLFKLPGDIFIKRGNFTFSFPIMTSIILSIILTLLVNLFLRR